MGLSVLIEGDTFRDPQGRVLTLRGVNFTADCKFPTRPNQPSHIPDDFFDGDNVSFVGRPFPLVDASEHFARMKRWGYNMIRYVWTWEAIEHAGPGKYDEEWIDFTISILREAKKWDIFVYMDPHQDVWSRFSGGSGAPLWTLYACGFDPKNFAVTEAAMVHNTFPEPELYPKMVWATNYTRLVSQVMFTFFFAGREFAPKAIIDGKNIQDYLQDHYYGAYKHLIKKVAEAGDLLDEVVIGWETINEPNRGLVGLPNLNAIPPEQKLQKDTSPTAWQAILTGSGRACEVATWDFGSMGPYKTGTRLVDPKGVKAWLSPEDWDDTKYGWKRDPEWKLGECIWAQHGVWDPETDTLLKPDYFSKSPIDGTKYDAITFTNKHWLDFYRRHAETVRSVHKDAILFAQAPVLEIPPKIKGTDLDDPRIVFTSHYYDGITLLTKRWNRVWNIDVLGVLRGRYLTPAFAIKLGETAIRNCLRDQLAGIRKEGLENMGEHPCVFGEIGIPFDMQDKHAYKTGDYTDQIRATDANHFAIEGSGAAGYSWWCYVANNNHQWGDLWNGEDLSIHSLNDKDIPVSSITPETLKSALSTPSIETASSKSHNRLSSNAPSDISVAGSRAAEAFIRPSPIVTAGKLLSYGFDLKNCEFTLKIQNTSSQSSSDEESEQLPTEIYLPSFHFPREETEVNESSGRWVIGDDEFGVQIMKWWLDPDAKGEQKLVVKGPKMKHLQVALADDDSYISQCGNACSVM